ncbi:uncharacterized protein LOC108665372 [Hyalella azteca]|uniref:Uncharacterized protein LOC108665372 n=1 Tax=Hyalella azteca TaxID=294128 RepID=A0A8B7N309_HYAAZ|nr:uncharacterized protein LOC108665372 [Hyalella azteca]
MSVLEILQYLGPVLQYFAPPALVFYTMKRQHPMSDFFSKRHKDSTGDEELARLRDWRGKLHFKDLDDLGISAFREFLSPHDSRRLDFWCSGPARPITLVLLWRHHRAEDDTLVFLGAHGTRPENG